MQRRIFTGKRVVSRDELGKALRSYRNIPGTGGRRYSRREIDKMEKDVFRPSYGSEISRTDYRRAVKRLEEGRRTTRMDIEKKSLDQKIRYLKELGGIHK